MAESSVKQSVKVPDLANYWQRSQRPLQSLIFLLPLLLIYELAMAYYAHGGEMASQPQLYAELLLRKFMQWFGVGGVYLPGLVMVVVLLVIHLIRKDPWRIEPRLYFGMGIESLALALPLFIFASVIFRVPVAYVLGMGSNAYTPVIAQAMGAVKPFEPSWGQSFFFSIGAGIYEELLFRLIAIAMLHLVFVDLIKLSEKVGATLAVLGSAILFSLYHFNDGNEFTWFKAVFYFVAGTYFAIIYVLRGLGVVASTHAIYDLLVVLLKVS